MLSLALALVVAAAPLQDTAHVVLVATTDLHGHATDWDYVADRPYPGGVARVAAVADSLRARYPGQVVLVDAGDLLQGDPFATYYARVAPVRPHPIIEALNLAGYDAATPGNHDFDWGVPFFQQAVAEARFPYVSANLYAGPGDSLLYPAWRVVQRQGVRVAITGFTTPGTMVWDREQMGRARIRPILPAAAPVLEAMRRDADVIVVLAHSGLGGRASYDTTGVGEENVAAALAGLRARPDVVVVGHSHRELRDSLIAGVHFVQPKPFGGSVSVVHLDLARDGGTWRVRRIRADLVSTRDVVSAPLLAQRQADERDAVRAWARTPVGLATVPLRESAARVGPAPALDFIQDVQRRRTGADLSAASAFDLRAGFDADTIRVAHLLALYPYDNTLRAIRLSGAQLRAYLEWSARYYQVDPAGRIGLNDTVPGYNYDVVAGASYDIDLRRPVGDRVQRLSVRGRLVQPGDSFTMAINSYRQTGAGGYDMVRGAPVVYDKGERIVELLIDAVRSRTPLDSAELAGVSSWRIVPEMADRAVRGLFNLPAPPLPKATRDTVVLRVLATGDLHGRFLPGAAALAATFDSLGADCGCPQLRLDAGDAMQGTPVQDETRGRAGMELLGRLGYAAAAVGDHDFDWSAETLRQRMTESSYPWLAANVVDSATGRRPDWLVPYRMLDVAGMPVAVIGYITPDTKASLPDDRTRGLRFNEGELGLHDVLAEVAGRKPAATILLAHAGGSCDSVVCTGEIVRLAEQLGKSGINLIVAGHTHRVITTRVAGIPILETGSGGRTVGVADLVKTPAGGLEFRIGVVPVDSARAGGNAELRAALDTYHRRSDSVLTRPLATLKRPLVREGTQYPLGGLIAEARRNVLRTDLGLVRTASIHADLPAGGATYERLSAVEPDRSDLVKVTLSAVQLTALLEQALALNGGATVHLAGAQVRYDPRAPTGRRVREVVLQGGRKLRRDAEVTLATDLPTVEGAGDLTVLRGLTYQRAGLLDVEAVAGFLRRLPQPVEVGPAATFVSTRS
jgi:2',3'-cyclic-nucleotide 2'-phosphodiesterase / 3'-nucleotidase / 5'-nucleotidase